MHLGARLDGRVVAQRDTGGAATPAHVGASLVRVRVRVRVRVSVKVETELPVSSLTLRKTRTRSISTATASVPLPSWFSPLDFAFALAFDAGFALGFLRTTSAPSASPAVVGLAVRPLVGVLARADPSSLGSFGLRLGLAGRGPGGMMCAG